MHYLHDGLLPAVHHQSRGEMSYTIEQLATVAHSRHGVNCPKVKHLDQRSGYLHGPDDDRPYDVDGVIYCGRCHGWIGTTAETGADDANR